jgi:hypothetical protein
VWRNPARNGALLVEGKKQKSVGVLKIAVTLNGLD